MSSEFKVPSFISNYFSTLSHEEKQEAVQRYKSWYKNDFTELFVADLERQRTLLIKEDEEQSDFVSWFQFSYKKAYNRAKRTILRELIKKLNYEV